MDQNKIGIFIQTIRKEKGMTQKDLAEKLNVSTNAVSKWERGICLMDISLLKPLSNILDVSIAEIISAEKLTENELTNEMLEKTFLYYKNKHKYYIRKKYKSIFLILFTILALSIFGCKLILRYNIKKIENEIVETTKNFDFGTQNFHSETIRINSKPSDNYYEFKDMRIVNIFENAINQDKTKYMETYEFSTNKKIVLRIDEGIYNNLDIYDNAKNIKDKIIKNYIKKKKLTTNKLMTKFISDFEFEKTSIFTSIFKLNDYFEKLLVYNEFNYDFNDYYRLDAQYYGELYFWRDNIITLCLEGFYDTYRIYFFGFSLNETIQIAETIEFVE